MRLDDATAADLAVLARLHTESWRIAYRGIFPDSYLDGDLYANRLAKWRTILAENGEWGIIAREGEQAVGFVWVSEREVPVAESLHMLPGRRGGGGGPLLFAAAAERLIARGQTELVLYVFAGNAPAIRFYDALGGQMVGQGIDDIAGHKVPDLRYRWTDLPALVAACRARAQSRQSAR